MTAVDDFLNAVRPTLATAETAIHNGDPAPRFAMWSHEDPVTVFGAAATKIGWNEIAPAFEWLASTFSHGAPADYELVAAGASGDLGYMAGFEHTTVSMGGEPRKSYTLRVTLVFRRENGEWKVVHRHADPPPDTNAAGVALELRDRLPPGT
jgi:ketosteroid isomerase-like protein